MGFRLTILLAALVGSCSAIPEDVLKDSFLASLYNAPLITPHPNPEDAIPGTEVQAVFNISNPGGIGEIVLDVNGVSKTYDAKQTSSYQIKQTLSVAASGSVPVGITAYSSRTGASTKKNYNYLFDSSTMADPPIITLDSPTNNSLVALGPLSVRGRVSQAAAKVTNLVIRRQGESDRSYVLTPPYGSLVSFNEPFTATTLGNFDFSVSAVAGNGQRATETFQFTIVNEPIIASITPDPSRITITTLSTNFSVVVQSPSSGTTVRAYWNNVLQDTRTVDGSGSPLIVTATIPRQPIATPVGLGTLRIEAEYPGSALAVAAYTYSIDHSALLSAPIISGITPPSGPLASASPLALVARVEQASPGLKEVVVEQVSAPGQNFTTAFAAIPPTSLYNITETFNIGSYAGNIDFRIRAISQADVTNIVNWTYTLPSSAITLSPASGSVLNGRSNQIFTVTVNDTSILSNVTVSTNRTSPASSLAPAIIHAPRSSTFSTNFTFDLPNNNQVFRIKVASLNALGIVTTNDFTYSIIQPSPYLATISPSPGSTTVPNSSFPISLRVNSPMNISSLEVRAHGATIFFTNGISGTNSVFYEGRASLVLGTTDQLRIYVNGSSGGHGTEVAGSPVNYTVVASGTRIFASFPQDLTVLTSDTVRIRFTNLTGSSVLPANQSFIEKREGLTEVGSVFTINSAITAGGDYTMPAASAFSLDYGLNKFRITLRGSGSVPDLVRDITIYRQDTLY